MMPVPPGCWKNSGIYFFSTSSRVLSSMLSKYLSDGKCLGIGTGASGSPNSNMSTTSLTHLSTHLKTSGAPESKIRPVPIGSRTFFACASSRQPRALAASTAISSADAKPRTSSSAVTASRKEALNSFIFALAPARRESRRAARFLKGSPKRSPDFFKASTPSEKHRHASFQSSRSMAVSPAALASSARAKKISTSHWCTATSGTGTSPPNFFQPVDGTVKDSVGAPYRGDFW
mmetsp:Transcript_83715/g.217942  ORF Transcript_83715/g.217942 Transcript_83715/m.217942 type:complete len:233 (-) Transcript_83715:274-972(-)